MSFKLSSNSGTKALRLSAQEQLVPGGSLEEKFSLLTQLGYHGIEVRSKGDFAFRERLREFRAALSAGVIISSACVDMPYFIGDFDPGKRRQAVDDLRSQLGTIAEIGGAGVVAPASYGLFSRRLPPYTPPRSPEEDRDVLLNALAELGQTAREAGAALFLEPLNRYEDFLINTLGQGSALIHEVGEGGLKLCADFYHMNVEEDDIAQALLDASPHLGHIHLSDSNRNEPGRGHIDWLSGLAALQAIGYSGWMVLECRPRGEAVSALSHAQQTIMRAHASL